MTHLFSRVSLAAIVAGALVASAPAHALSAKECRAAFNKAKSAGTLDGQKYKAFKAAQCGTDAKAEDAKAADAGAAGTKTGESKAGAAGTETAKTGETKAAATAAPAASAPVTSPTNTSSAPRTAVAASGNVVFPTAISAQYAKLSAGRARQKTCVAQYNANKANGGNGNLKWIQRGGGYWSQCNARLKGAK